MGLSGILWIVLWGCAQFSVALVLGRRSYSGNFAPHAVGKGFGSTRRKRVVPGIVGPPRTVPDHILRPNYVSCISSYPHSEAKLTLRSITPSELERMRIAGRLAREVLDLAVLFAQVGVSTDAIDELVHSATIARNSYPSPLGFHQFPKSCCTSINEVMCHGIPDNTVLEDGDIVNIDVTLFYEGVHGDCSETVIVGKGSREVRDLVRTAHLAMDRAISICQPGMEYNEIGGVVEELTTRRGFTVARGYCGHGINTEFHTEPTVLHHRNRQPLGRMEVGHTFTIEPIVCTGSSRDITWPDNWTVVSADGLPSAQFEQTLLIVEGGVEVLTKKLPSSPKYFWEL